MRKTTTKGRGLKAKLTGKAKAAKSDTLRIADRMEGRVRAGTAATSARTATLRSGSTARTGTVRRAVAAKTDALATRATLRASGRARASSTALRGDTATSGTLRTGRRATPALATARPVATGRRTALTTSTRTAAAATTTGGSRRKAGRGGAGATVMRPHEGPNATPSRKSPRTIEPLLSGKTMRVR